MSNSEIAIYAASKAVGVSKSMILSRTRYVKAVEARRIVVLLLLEEGATLDFISKVLRRSSGITMLQRTAREYLEYSKTFRDKYNKASELYEQQKSLRLSQD